jgi:DnaJ-class molecular chaperone
MEYAAPPFHVPASGRRDFRAGRREQEARPSEAYLDRRSTDWRSRNCGDGARTKNNSPRGATMTAGEAYDVLGLKPGAKEEQIRAAHRRLMMKFHPDQGGLTYLAARINEAKEVLMAIS